MAIEPYLWYNELDTSKLLASRLFMMTEKMKAAVAATEFLDPEIQDKIADRLLDIVDNHRWQVLFADPRSDILLDELVARDDAAQTAGDSGKPLDELFAEWDRKHGFNG
jgi:hypothetical protein